MEVKKTNEEGHALYHIKGRIDTQTAPELQSMLDESFANGEKNLTLDFKEVDYMSSAGLRTVLYAQKRINTISGADMVIINVQPVVMEVFEMTGFTDFLKINPQ